MTLPKTGNSKLIDLAHPAPSPSGALDQEARELLFALRSPRPFAHKTRRRIIASQLMAIVTTTLTRAC
jgi:hypothetical protein